MMIATEYIQAKVMNRGIERLMTCRNLQQRGQDGLDLYKKTTHMALSVSEVFKAKARF